MTDEFPRRKAVTRGFRLGAPRTVTISPDGERLLYLRSEGPTDPVNHLWLATWTDGDWTERRLVDSVRLLSGGPEGLPAEERARRERLREVSGGITGYSVARDWSCVAFVLSGQLWVCAPSDGEPRAVGSAGDFANPTVAPDGSRVAVTSGPRVLLVDPTDGSQQTLLEPGSPTQAWGTAEFIAAEEMNRFAGMWWAPDSERLLVARVDEEAVQQWWIADPAQPLHDPTEVRYPAAGTTNASVSLHLVSITGDQVAVTWDATEFEYLARAHWGEQGLVLAVQNRAQTSVRTLAVAADGSTRVLAEDADDRWVELVPGVPRLVPDGLALARVDGATDTRRLVVLDDAGKEVAGTPAGMQLHLVVAADDASITFVASETDPSSCDLWQLSSAGNLTRLSEPQGWSSGTAAAGTVVVSRADLAAATASLTVTRSGNSWTIPSRAESPDLVIRPEFLTDDRGWSHIAVLWPANRRDDPLPVVMSPYGGPHAQRSIRAAGAFATEQWLADQGFCVVVADGPGAPSRPSNEFALHRDLAGPPLAGQVRALEQVLATYPGRLDANRVGIRGWSFGGYLAALTVLQRPDLFHVAVAGAPVTDWSLYDTHYTERYLGQPQTDGDAYDRSSLLPRAAEATQPRPLLLVHGMADDNVVVAHTLRLSSALLAAGYPHTVLPLSGVTHMTPQEIVAENLLKLELQFLQTHLR